MEKYTPIQQTLSLIFSWILGSMCLLLSILYISSGYITSAFFMFLAAVMALPPTANMVISKVNYSLSNTPLSDTLRFVIVTYLSILSNAAMSLGAP